MPAVKKLTKLNIIYMASIILLLLIFYIQNNRIASLESQVHSLNYEISSIATSSDIDSVKQDINSLQNDVRSIQDDVSSVEDDPARNKSDISVRVLKKNNLEYRGSDIESDVQSLKYPSSSYS